LEQLNARGSPFKHPGGDYEAMACNDCHTGSL